MIMYDISKDHNHHQLYNAFHDIAMMLRSSLAHGNTVMMFMPDAYRETRQLKALKVNAGTHYAN